METSLTGWPWSVFKLFGGIITLSCFHSLVPILGRTSFKFSSPFSPIFTSVNFVGFSLTVSALAKAEK